MEINDVVQFNENHKWRGCFGIITEIKKIYNADLKGEGIIDTDTRFMVGVPVPQERNSIYICISK